MIVPETLLVVGPFEDWGDVLATAFLTLFLVFGLVGIGSAFRQFWRASLIARSDPIDAGSVYLADGEVELEGEVQPIETTQSPYTDTDCVAYTYELKERERTTDADGNTTTHYETIDSGSGRRPFRVRDESGAVVVDPDGAELSLDTEKVSGGHRQKYEGTLDPGETVHVYGQKCEGVTAEETIDGEDCYVGDGDAVSEFMVSDATEFRTTLRYVGSGVGRLLLFVALTAFVGGFFLVVVVDGVFGIDVSPVFDPIQSVLS